jgi:hypothetical protein
LVNAKSSGSKSNGKTEVFFNYLLSQSIHLAAVSAISFLSKQKHRNNQGVAPMKILYIITLTV